MSDSQDTLPEMPQTVERRLHRGCRVRVWNDPSSADRGDIAVPTSPLDQRIMLRGIALSRGEMEKARLAHPSDIKRLNILQSLAVLADANRAGGIAHVLEEGPDNPHYDDLSRYYGGDAKVARHQEYLLREESEEMIARACGECALKDGCLYDGNPHVLGSILSQPEYRKKFITGIAAAKNTDQDFDCMELVRSGSRRELKAAQTKR